MITKELVSQYLEKTEKELFNLLPDKIKKKLFKMGYNKIEIIIFIDTAYINIHFILKSDKIKNKDLYIVYDKYFDVIDFNLDYDLYDDLMYNEIPLKIINNLPEYYKKLKINLTFY